ncbi:pyruvate carboxylase subunit B [Draconibacterium orientale]|uniref:Oxaloacetate decarboxylase n=1 Tax=Draconibacterium orientale TaxID=1168034 RepID=X5DGX8_9BACT|nr:biotin/lipoyl-containing protein [Draconibacterium orientale]AHW60304.1 oxaloacetate decarboxylase [Draconibacterium orientale]SEU12204.1 pyruvate carboxylase subunit B [Draconibacterium orientale]
MKKEIKFSLLYRDMWQSSGKYVPKVEQLEKVAPAIIDMGCFDRVETNGGGFEQINLLFGENPNIANRRWTQPFNDAGIQTHMLERALNGIRMSPVSADVRKLMFKVKKLQGTDIARSFCGLNDPRNLENSIKFAKEGGMISQAALSLTISEVHTVEYYTNLANILIEMGADEICVKDMAGIGRPAFIGKIIKNIKTAHPKTTVQYHGHSGPGFSMASILEAARAGVDYVDVAMEPLSWGTGHADVLAVQGMLKDAGYAVKEVNMKAYMEVRSMTQEFIDDFLGYYINPKNRHMNSLLIGSGLPGGMMGSLMADLGNNLESLNKWLTKRNKSTLTQDDLLIKLFDEVEYIWPKLGYPPLVTPFSQYVKNLALMNVLQVIKGRERWSMIADNIWDMIIGKSGKLPGELAPEIVELAKANGKEFFTGVPQELYPDNLDVFRKEMDDNGWDYGQDDEELLELAMHPEQYRAYKSGKAKADFEADLAAQKAAKEPKAEKVEVPAGAFEPKSMIIDVNGEKFKVGVSYDGAEAAPAAASPAPAKVEAAPVASGNVASEVIAPLEGKFMLTKDTSETALKIGDKVKEGDLICYIESMKTYNAVVAESDGTVTAILKANGDNVDEDDVLVQLS